MVDSVDGLIAKIISSAKELPAEIPLAEKTDRIHTAFAGSEGEDPWHTFNKRFDAIFGEDCCDKDGRLCHIRRGQYGMGIVSTYLGIIDANVMPEAPVKLKLVWLLREIDHLM